MNARHTRVADTKCRSHTHTRTRQRAQTALGDDEERQSGTYTLLMSFRHNRHLTFFKKKPPSIVCGRRFEWNNIRNVLIEFSLYL